MTTDPQTVRIFLASSAELKPDREAFEQAIARRNKEWNPRGVFLHLDIWEDLSAAMSPTRSQDEYNREIDRCDIFVVLFWTKVGRYTAEEFERAYARFKGGDDSARAPTIFVCEKTVMPAAWPTSEDVLSREAFQKRLAGLEHFLDKNLSVNYIHCQRYLPKRDDGGREVVECKKAAFELFIAHQQLAEAVEPAVGDLDNPAASPLGGMAFEFPGLLATPLHVGNVAMIQDGFHRRCATVAGIGAQVFRAPFRRRRALDLDGLEHRLQLRHIMPIRAGHDE